MKNIKYMKKLNYKKTVENLRRLVKDYIIKSNLNSLVLGISGGIDSALVAVLVKPVCDDLNIPLIGRSITIGSNSPEEIKRAKDVGESFCTDFKEVDLTQQFETMKSLDGMEQNEDFESIKYKIRMGNIKARMRMIYLYNIASLTGGLVLSTDNESELNSGFFTIFGDQGDYAPIQHLWKTEVYDMSEWLTEQMINEHEADALMSCITGDATDGLGITKTDLDQLIPDWRNRHTSTRSGYKEVDQIFHDYFEAIDNLNSTYIPTERYKFVSLIEKMNESELIKRYNRTHFKRNHPYIIDRNDFVILR